MTKHIYIPGDKWLYFNIYCGVKVADELLTKVLAPLVQQFQNQGIIQKWFFIRYADPDTHLRVRFELSNYHAVGVILELLNKELNPWVESQKVWRINIDSYKPENNRYHPGAIHCAEQLFFYDSECTVQFLNAIAGDEGDEFRWKFSLLNINYFLNDFGFSMDEKKQLLIQLKDNFSKEFNISGALKRPLDKKYRALTPDIKKVLQPKGEVKDNEFFMHKLLEKRSDRNKQIAKELVQLAESDSSIQVLNLLPSYIHMIMNRLFRSKQRMHELVVYDFLSRYYTSEVAKLKYSKPKKKEVLV